ncbi:hypothetical protein AAFF_G00130600 [Aldrovandia affinis]|uniref:Serine palmitoyltransferase small subunit B n=1 Tax=Aldrovandia affinis TaxID=143900 RepID=A0AAD7RQM3_9TELE|nr:hypothetical protein AAFF_G00130600 [Aldrovandia affinis]
MDMRQAAPVLPHLITGDSSQLKLLAWQKHSCYYYPCGFAINFGQHNCRTAGRALGCCRVSPTTIVTEDSSMDVKNLKEYLCWLYYQYLLITSIYVLEPWEQSIFNTVLFTMVAMVIYTSYVFVPIHVRLALEFFSGLCGGQQESTVALIN